LQKGQLFSDILRGKMLEITGVQIIIDMRANQAIRTEKHRKASITE